MLRNTIIVAAVVASLALMCRAQAPVEQAPAQIKAQAELRARMAVAQEQMQRMQQAADEAKQAGQAKESSAPSHRVQVLLLEINANAEHPKLSALRAAAQSGKATAGLIAIADELIAAGVGSTSCNVTTIVRSGLASTLRNEEEVPFVAKSQTSGNPQMMSQGGTYSRGYRVDCESRAESSETAVLKIEMQSSTSADAKTELPGLRLQRNINWGGSWSGPAGSEAVLLAETPRKPGDSGGAPPIERYLLLRVDAFE